MSCKVQITTYDKADALVVPKKAVHDDKDDPDQHYVWLVDPDDAEAKPTRRTVKLGKRKDEDVEILKGLKKGNVISLDDEEAKRKAEKKKIKPSSNRPRIVVRGSRPAAPAPCNNPRSALRCNATTQCAITISTDHAAAPALFAYVTSPLTEFPASDRDGQPTKPPAHRPIRQSPRRHPRPKPEPITPPKPEEITASIERGIKFLLADQRQTAPGAAPNTREVATTSTPRPRRTTMLSTPPSLRSSSWRSSKPSRKVARNRPARNRQSHRPRRRMARQPHLAQFNRATPDALYNVWGHSYSIQACRETARARQGRRRTPSQT